MQRLVIVSTVMNTIYLTRCIGAFGMVFPITAQFLPQSDMQASLYIIGSLLMLIAAAWEKSLFFSMLQIIVLAGASMYFTPYSMAIHALVPIALAIATCVYFYLAGRIKDRVTYVGLAGIAALALGYAIAHPWIYLIGGVLLTIYSWVSYQRGVAIAILWAILNFVFSIAAVLRIVGVLAG